MQVNPANDVNAVVAALKNAAQVTDTDFQYLLGTAMRESGLKTNAQSLASSAGGLFQFLDQTWLGLVKNHGAKYGLGSLAQAIGVTPDGRYRADNETDRNRILSLKKDPQVSALMAGEYARASAGAMQSALGRPVCGGELYAAHFLGPEGACKLIRSNERAPSTNAAHLFPEAASANHAVFFHADGSAKSVREVYAWAMRQPGSEAAPPEPQAPAAVAVAANAVSANIESLVKSVVNWQPASFFGGEGPTTMSLGSGLLDLLSTSRDQT
jgi:hypothetical protein